MSFCFYSISGAKKVTNKATLWYVPFSLQNVDKIVEVPAIEVNKHFHIEKSFWKYVYSIDSNHLCMILVGPNAIMENNVRPHTVYWHME